MPLSSMPSPGPTLPDGCTNVKVSYKGQDPANRVDVTTLSDTDRVYESPPLVDPGTQSVTASFILQGSPPAVSAITVTTGWICTEVEIEYAVGEYAKGTATYMYVE